MNKVLHLCYKLLRIVRLRKLINHRRSYKKLTRINADGTYSNDKKNTFFLEDQITEALTASLKPETKYFIRVNAYDASNSASLSTPYSV